MKQFVCLLLGLLMTFDVAAALLISPTRVVIEGRERSGQLVVVNNSNEVKTYRLSWIEKQSLPSGASRLLKEATEWSVSSMARISPKQVRLAPGERQIIKFRLRKPADLKEGEYRSYLQLKAIPEVKEIETDNIGIQVNMLLSYTLPLIYRTEKTTPNVNLSNLAVINEKGFGKIALEFTREGKFSSHGMVEVFFTPSGSKNEERVAVVSSFNIYPETDVFRTQLSLIDPSPLKNSGTFRIRYKGEAEFKGVTFFETSQTHKKQNIVIL